MLNNYHYVDKRLICESSTLSMNPYKNGEILNKSDYLAVDIDLMETINDNHLPLNIPIKQVIHIQSAEQTCIYGEFYQIPKYNKRFYTTLILYKQTRTRLSGSITVSIGYMNYGQMVENNNITVSTYREDDSYYDYIVLPSCIEKDFDSLYVKMDFNTNDIDYKFVIITYMDLLAQSYKYNDKGQVISLLTKSGYQYYNYDTNDNLISNNEMTMSYNGDCNNILSISGPVESNKIYDEETGYVIREENNDQTIKQVKIYNYLNNDFLNFYCDQLLRTNYEYSDLLLIKESDRLVLGTEVNNKRIIDYEYYNNDTLKKKEFSSEAILLGNIDYEYTLNDDNELIDELSKVNRYSFIYDNLHRLEKVLLLSKEIIEYTYNLNLLSTKKINETTYIYTYDNYQRLVSISKNTNTNILFSFIYDNETNELISIHNEILNITTSYVYLKGLLSNYFTNNKSINYIYDKETIKDKQIFQRLSYHYSHRRLDDEATLDNIYNQLAAKSNPIFYVATFNKKITSDNINVSCYLVNGFLIDNIPTIIDINGEEQISLESNIENKYNYSSYHVKNNDTPLVYDISRFYMDGYVYNFDSFTVGFIFKFGLIGISLFSLKSGDSTDFYVKYGNGKLTIHETNSYEFLINLTQNEFHTFVITVGTPERYSLYIDGIHIITRNTGSSIGQPYMIVFPTTYDDYEITGVFVTPHYEMNITEVREYDFKVKRALEYNKCYLDYFYTEPYLSIKYIENDTISTTINEDINYNVIDLDGIYGNTLPCLLSKGSDKRIFHFDSELQKKVYITKSHTLAYDLGLKDSGTIAIMFKLNETPTTESRIIECTSDNKVFRLLINNSNHVILYFCGNSKTSTIEVALNTWSMITLRWSRKINSASILTNSYYVNALLNGTELFTESEYALDESFQENQMIYIGSSSLNAYIEKVIYSSSEIITSSINTLYLKLKRRLIFSEKRSPYNALLEDSTSYEENQIMLNKYRYDNYGNIVQNKLYIYLKTIYMDYTYNFSKKITSNSETEIINGTSIIKTIQYEYDSLGRLISETNPQNVKYTYEYDDLGNLLYKKQGQTVINKYEYDVFKCLIKFNNDIIDYNNILNTSRIITGNDIIDFIWEANKLIEYIIYTTKYKFYYDESGRRIKKEKYVNNVLNESTSFYYDESGLLIYSNKGTETIDYLYNYGDLKGIRVNGNNYLYIKDITGVIRKIVDSNGIIVAEYIYDAWGNILDINCYNNSNIGNINPIRYKGYYYDVETELYYCMSRYYKPLWGRWISNDSIDYLDPESINGLNLYAYSGNDPVNYYITSNKLNYSSSIQGPEYTNSILAPTINNTLRNSQWKDKWFDTDWPSFCTLTDDGFELLNWSLSIYKGSLFLDSNEQQSLYVSFGNIDTYAGVNYKKGIGISASANVAEIGYDGRVIDVSIEGLSVGITYMYKDGEFRFKKGFGWWGVAISIDISKLIKLIFGGE